MSNSKPKPARGRPQVGYVDDALKLVEKADTPISTTEIMAELKLNEHEAINLRRGLRRAKDCGLIELVANAPDNSYAWLSKGKSATNYAAHAANLYLKRVNAGVEIDPEMFESWIETGIQKMEGLV